MKDLNKKIIEYINVTIKTKRNMQQRISELEKELEDAKENEKYALKTLNKYKKKLREMRKKENVMIKITNDNYVLKRLFPKKDIVSLSEIIYQLETLYFENGKMIEKLPDYVIKEIDEDIYDNYEDMRLTNE